MKPQIQAFEVGDFPVEVVAEGKKVKAKKGEYIIFGFTCGPLIVSKEVFESEYKKLCAKG